MVILDPVNIVDHIPRTIYIHISETITIIPFFRFFKLIFCIVKNKKILYFSICKSKLFIKSGEYYGAAEPPVRCGESHLSGLTEPPHFFIKLLCHCWIQSIYFSHREVFSWVNTFNIDLIGIIRYAIHDGIGKSTFTITDLLVPLTFTELRTKDC